MYEFPLLKTTAVYHRIINTLLQQYITVHRNEEMYEEMFRFYRSTLLQQYFYSIPQNHQQINTSTAVYLLILQKFTYTSTQIQSDYSGNIAPTATKNTLIWKKIGSAAGEEDRRCCGRRRGRTAAGDALLQPRAAPADDEDASAAAFREGTAAALG
jgi:hypothetical protein